MPPGTLLALYTDGLIESRDSDLDHGMERLARALGQAGRPLEQLCDGILDLLPAAPQDDVAVLLARTAHNPPA